jgi:hypothetical protein
MNATLTSTKLAAGYAVAGATLCLGLFFSMKADDEAGTLIIRGAYLLAALIVLKLTFAWGHARGFPVLREDGSIAVSHVLRNLVMAIIVGASLLFISAPFMMVAFKLAR